jgi:hypothetical protein
LTASWIDLVLIGIMILAVALGARRGFGKVVFDFAALLIALRLTDMFYQALSRSVTLTSDKHANLAWCYAALFVVLGLALWFIGKSAYDATLISLDTFDAPLGALLGLSIALILGHVLAKTVFLLTLKNGVSPVIQQTVLGSEFFSFDTYHRVVDAMRRLGD